VNEQIKAVMVGIGNFRQEAPERSNFREFIVGFDRENWKMRTLKLEGRNGQDILIKQ
jgi:hypothetical protein